MSSTHGGVALTQATPWRLFSTATYKLLAVHNSHGHDPKCKSCLGRLNSARGKDLTKDPLSWALIGRNKADV